MTGGGEGAKVRAMEGISGGAPPGGEPLIRDITDTARWVAAIRAQESERPNPLFRDPFAGRLAGERGREIAAEMAARVRADWPMPIRTYAFDSMIREHIAGGGDAVVNLAAGLDARPYRMDLPPALRWIEVDLPPMIEHKESVLASETPRCKLRRVRLDLSNRDARRALFAELGREGQNILVLTEGLLVYLDPSRVTELSEDLAAQPTFRQWAIDLLSPGLRLMLMRQFGAKLEEAQVPFRFAPEEGPGFFAPQGWHVMRVMSLFKTASKLSRLPLWMRLFALLPESNGRQGKRPWGAVCLLGK